MGRVEDRELRREWIHRVTDHDGTEDDPGGIMRWLILTRAIGLDDDYVTSYQGALPAVRFAVHASAQVNTSGDDVPGSVVGQQCRIGAVRRVAEIR